MPEIYYDDLFYLIKECVKHFKPKHILEVGSWDGTGSTQAFIQGITENNLTEHSTLYCIEAQKCRFDILRNNTKDLPYVKCYCMLSGDLKDSRSEQSICEFLNNHPKLGVSTKYPKDEILSWKKREDEWAKGVIPNGIIHIKNTNNINKFNVVLLDGSGFFGLADFRLTRDSDVFILDDINALKNYENYMKLKGDKNYKLLKEDWNLRNGYAIFAKHEAIP
jgi:hypothetical protein